MIILFGYYSRAISSLEENEIKLQTELALQKEAEDKFVLLSNAYIEYLDGDSLFQQMFALDEGKYISYLVLLYLYLIFSDVQYYT